LLLLIKYKLLKSIQWSLKSFLKSLGPGIIAGSTDDDPSSIVTFAQAGAKFGLGLLLTAIFCILL
jgi:Mn2+/Fe2+ NRAMP family transporter